MTIERQGAVRYAWLDYGRVLSALAVVVFHYTSNGVRNGNVGDGVERFGAVSAVGDYGYLGVDFFFIVSGFVIFFSALGQSADRFAVSRVVRLYPAFLFCLAVTTLVLLLTDFRPVTTAKVLANLTMLPSFLAQDYIDGVYWTLKLEVVFYAAVFVAIATGAINFPYRMVGAAVVLIAAAYAGGAAIPVFGTYAVLFALGCSLALLYRDGWTRRTAPLVAVTAALAIDASRLRATLRLDDFPDLQPALVAGVTAVFVAAFLLMRSRDVKNTERARRWGALTYPLYLLHAYAGYALLSQVQTDATKWILTPLAILVAVVAAHFVAVHVEQRHAAMWKRCADASVGRLIRAGADWSSRRGATAERPERLRPLPSAARPCERSRSAPS